MYIMDSLDIFLIILYFLVILLISFYFASKQKETTLSYFLADRNLGWIAIGASLFAANISSEHFMGLAGYGATNGLAVGNFEWMAIFPLMLLGWLFAPLFIKAKVFTVPEFFGKRFNRATRLYLSAITIMVYILTKISISLFAGGLLLKSVYGWDIYTSAMVIMMITGLYTIIGGLSAVVYTSVVQGFLLILGAVILTFFGFNEVGGLAGLHQKLPASYFSLFKPVSDANIPWTGIILGAPILGIWYWCADQFMVQRILGSKSVCAARSGTILAGFLKLLPVFILVLPGLVAAALFPGVEGDDAYPILLYSSIIPAGMKGIVLIGVIAAIMSSLAGSFISTSTLFTMDFYRHFNPDTPEKKLVLVGRLSTIGIVVVGMLWIPLVKILNTQIYVYLQSLQAYVSPPIVAAFLLGIFWERMNGTGALWGLIGGGIAGLLRMIQQWINLGPLTEWHYLNGFFTMNFLHFAVFLFLFSAGIMVVVSLLSQHLSIQQLSRSREFFENIKPVFSGRALLAEKDNRYAYLFSFALFVVLFGLWGLFF
jgi:SSS family solute:Na+ symporter